MAVAAISLIGLTLLVLWSRMVVQQAVVKGVKPNGDLTGEFLAEKRRYQAFWDDWKFTVGLGAGAIAGWVLRGWL